MRAFSAQSSRGPVRARAERGNILVVAVLMLLMMSILGLTGIKATRTESRLAGNTQERVVAFQAAEAALRQAETFLQQPSLPAFVGGGLYVAGAAPDPLTMNASNSFAYSNDLEGVFQPPRYYIERLSNSDESDSIVIGTDYGGGAGRTLYRVTAIGYGRNELTRSVLQVTFWR